MPELTRPELERQGCSSGKKEGVKVGVLKYPTEQPEKSPPVPRKMTALGKKVVKGGLSVFLSGALEAPKPLPPPPVTPKVEGPAWGGVNIPKGSASLLTIQTQQKYEPKYDFGQAVKVGSGKGLAGDKVHVTPKHAESATIVVEETEASSTRVPLIQFVRTSPIAVNPRSSSRGQPDNSPPPWAAATPGTNALSLRDIQMQQVCYQSLWSLCSRFLLSFLLWGQSLSAEFFTLHQVYSQQQLLKLLNICVAVPASCSVCLCPDGNDTDCTSHCLS